LAESGEELVDVMVWWRDALDVEAFGGGGGDEGLDHVHAKLGRRSCGQRP
jgi:hypothetical protein